MQDFRAGPYAVILIQQRIWKTVAVQMQGKLVSQSLTIPSDWHYESNRNYVANIQSNYYDYGGNQLCTETWTYVLLILFGALPQWAVGTTAVFDNPPDEGHGVEGL